MQNSSGYQRYASLSLAVKIFHRPTFSLDVVAMCSHLWESIIRFITIKISVEVSDERTVVQ